MKPKPVMVLCPACGRQLPIDFFECPDCGTRNPQLHQVKYEFFRVWLPPEVSRTMRRMAIKRGWSTDRFMAEAVEQYITKLGEGK